jgi:hypothetical protein
VLGWVSDNVATSIGFNTQFKVDEGTIQQIQNTEKTYIEGVIDINTATSTDPLSRMLGWGNEVVQKALSSVFEPFKKYFLSLPYMLINIGVPVAFAAIISAPLYAIEFIGIIQFVTGRSFKGMD